MSAPASTKSAKPRAQGEHHYRERAQPANRMRFGLLEKKKDWQARAKDHKKKRDHIEKLKRTALERNPDEFYMGMVGRNLKNGLLKQQNKRSLNVATNFKSEADEDRYLDNLLQKMRSRDEEPEDGGEVDFEEAALKRGNDLNFVRMRLMIETKKLKKMKKNLQATKMSSLNSNSKQNSHTHFASDDEEAEEIEKRLEKRQKLIDEKAVLDEEFKTDDAKATHKTVRLYRELSAQIDRTEKVRLLHDKLESRRAVANDERPVKQLKAEEESQTGVYFWPTKRYK